MFILYVATPLFFMIAGSTFLAYSWAPWWLQSYEYAGNFAEPDLLCHFSSVIVDSILFSYHVLQI
jgi:hypothetical protein